MAASYHNLLPSLDFDIGLTRLAEGPLLVQQDDCSCGLRHLGRWSRPRARRVVRTINGFTPGGNQNNPGILPLESDNFDLSVEYYFSDTGYVSAGFFEKNVENFIGNSIVPQNLYGITRPDRRPARTGCAATYLVGQRLRSTDDSALFTAMAMLRTPARSRMRMATLDGRCLANYNGTEAQHIAFASRYDVLPDAADPLYTFNVSTPINNKEAKIHGYEFGGQYFFGDSGFGVLANYTIVEGDVGFDDGVGSELRTSSRCSGLSDSANVVLMFEKFGFSARLAYNWRDEFLQNAEPGRLPQPDLRGSLRPDRPELSVMTSTTTFAVSFEAINLTGEDVRWHGRSVLQMWRLEDQGAALRAGCPLQVLT